MVNLTNNYKFIVTNKNTVTSDSNFNLSFLVMVTGQLLQCGSKEQIKFSGRNYSVSSFFRTTVFYFYRSIFADFQAVGSCLTLSFIVGSLPLN